ncbi:hypothetical protein D3C77_31640 [compost metagenome]|jgi:hypothetical protein
MCNKTLPARGEKNGARKGEGPDTKNIARIMPQGAGGWGSAKGRLIGFYSGNLVVKLVKCRA